MCPINQHRHCVAYFHFHWRLEITKDELKNLLKLWEKQNLKGELGNYAVEDRFGGEEMPF